MLAAHRATHPLKYTRLCIPKATPSSINTTTSFSRLRQGVRASSAAVTSRPSIAASAGLHTSTCTMFALTRFRGNPADQPKTFSKQDSLPRLPIPPLEQTFERYLQSLEPILLQAEELGHLSAGQTAQSELDKRRKWAAEAVQPGTLVQRLQQRLHDVDHSTPYNWLDDRFWLLKAYHEWRAPLLVNSNWWLMFRADPNTPAAELESPSTPADRQGSNLPDADMSKALGNNDWTDAAWGLRRATWMVYRLLLFKKRLDEQDILPDASRSAAFCMHQYTRVFGVTRIPAIPNDWNTATPHPAKAQHIVVMARNNFYKLQVLDERGAIIAPAALEKALTNIKDDAARADGKAVGVLTSNGRDEWARAREQLLSTSPRNRESINVIEEALFTLALDSSVLPLAMEHSEVAHASQPSSVDAHARNCSGAGRGGLNRWFDKALTLIVEPNGRAGIMGEHSPCDALIPSIVVEYAVAVPSPRPDEQWPADLEGVSEAAVGGVQLHAKFDFDIDAQSEANIQAAWNEARRTCGESDITELWFDEYGTDWIKKVAKQSPDAFVQQALQLAMTKFKGHQTPTYETASTRLFQHGRTDVIRSFSRESYELIKAIRQSKPSSEIYKLLSAATTAHTNQTRASSMGKGIDRHLAGLRLVYDAVEDGTLPGAGVGAGATMTATASDATNGISSQNNKHAPKPANFYAGTELLFADPLLGDSQTWKLSTSGLSAGNLLAGTGFGAGYLDGVGTNYLTGSHLLKFGIEAKHPEPLGKGEAGKDPAHAFARHLVDSLRYLRQICEQEAPPTSEGAKL